MFGRASMPIRLRRGLTEITMDDKNGNDTTIMIVVQNTLKQKSLPKKTFLHFKTYDCGKTK